MASLKAVSRRCERPACSEVAVVAYRFDASRLLVELLSEIGEVSTSGALCRRHADALVVPRGWTLDDQRDPTPRLFTVATNSASAAAKRESTPPRSRSRKRRDPEVTDPVTTPSPGPRETPASTPVGSQALHPRRRKRRVVPEETIIPLFSTPVADDDDHSDDVTVAELAGETPSDDLDETRALPWSPNFDLDDTLDGALDATTPLLGRAFTGRRRSD